MKNLIVGQSGGPTAVINSSLYGVIREGFNRSEEIEHVYGMINGIQLNHPSGQPVVDLCFKDANVLINNTNGNVLRFVPPLITGKEEIDLCIKAVDDAMTKLGW